MYCVSNNVLLVQIVKSNSARKDANKLVNKSFDIHLQRDIHVFVKYNFT